MIFKYSTLKKDNINSAMFTQGYCAEFAIALHEKTNYPIFVFEEIFEDGYTGFIHYAVKHPSGRFLDVKGSRTEGEILKSLLLSDTSPATKEKVVVRETSVEEIENTTEIVEEALELAREYITKPIEKKADFHSDRYYQQLAVSAFESVQDILKAEGAKAEREFEEYLDRGLNPPEYISDYLIQNPYYEGYELRAAEVGIPENQYPLIFIFGTKKKIPNPALGFTKQGKAVILFNNLKEPYHLTYAYPHLDKATFIHEFIHYLDMGRGNKETNNSFQGAPEEKDLQEYYNNPKEMNAYYQENIPSLYNIVESMVKNNYEPLTEVISSGYEAFFKFAIKFFNQRWWDYLTPENKRRVQKRLYAVFENLKEKYK